MSWVITYSGKRVDLIDTKPEQIDINDIAVALSRIPHWNGHTKKFLSVAEHSVNVSYAVPKGMEMAGLLHDAHEAYLGDWIRPVQSCCISNEGLRIKIDLQNIINKIFDCGDVDYNQIKIVDDGILEYERLVSLNILEDNFSICDAPIPHTLMYYSPDMAYKNFMNRFNYLMDDE